MSKGKGTVEDVVPVQFPAQSSPDVKTWLVSRKELISWLDRISSGQILIAPTDISGILQYHRVMDSSEIVFDFIRPKLSLKEVIFPPTELLFKIHRNGLELNLEETHPLGKTAVFGVRPCDARGMKHLDAVFLTKGAEDSSYSKRRENTILIGLGCKQTGPYCFCTSVGGRLDDASDMDIMVNETETGYLVQEISEKGHSLVLEDSWKKSNPYLQKNISIGEFPVPDKEKWPTHFRDEFWARIGERCLSCRACAYVCPTCRCFVIRDEKSAPNEFERIRCWDSCMGENYRRVAGGHKPRDKKGERQRNRFFCKFYYFPEQYNLGDTSACTGCGRCIEICPVGVDVTEVLTELESIV